MEKGVIVGSDKNQEWLLPWWWENYHKYNNLPVVFFDFGMSDAAKQFCEEKGTVISIKEELDTDIKNVPYEYLSFWKIRHGDFHMHNSRSGWFKKPKACLFSPFELTLWIDLDCEIKGALEPIYSFLNNQIDICIHRIYIDPEKDFKLMNLLKPDYFEKEIIYNSGVFLFRKHSSIIQDWCDLCINEGHLFHGDDEALSRIIFRKNYSVSELPQKYNVQFDDKDDPSTIIRHHVGPGGKIFLLNKIMLQII